MVSGKGFFDRAKQGFVSDQELATQTLFPGKSRLQMLQMITEVSTRAQMPWVMLGLFRRRFKSEVLEIIQEEHALNKIALDRKGRLELSEIFTSPRRKDEKEEE